MTTTALLIAAAFTGGGLIGMFLGDFIGCRRARAEARAEYRHELDLMMLADSRKSLVAFRDQILADEMERRARVVAGEERP
jgi:hypothetical protein